MAAFDVYGGFQMNIFVYSDESGVFDCYHSQYFVFGGVVFLDRETMESAARRYLTVEREIRKENLISSEDELKASNLERKNQRRLFRTTNREFRFGVVVEIPKFKIRLQIADDKKSRQRYTVKCWFKDEFDHFKKKAVPFCCLSTCIGGKSFPPHLFYFYICSVNRPLFSDDFQIRVILLQVNICRAVFWAGYCEFLI